MKKSWIVAVSAAGLLAGCFGGGDDTPAVTESVPTSASATASGFIDYLKQLVVASADTLEPVDVSAVTPPADDMAEPSIVD